MNFSIFGNNLCVIAPHPDDEVSPQRVQDHPVRGLPHFQDLQREPEQDADRDLPAAPEQGQAVLDPRFSFRTFLGISQKTLDILSESLRISQGFFKKAPESLNIEFLVV